MKKRIKKLKDTRVPYIHLKMGRDLIQLYRLEEQVTAIIYRDGTYYGQYTTSGGNYSKQDHALEMSYQLLGHRPKQDITYYHKGGNFYRVPVKEIRCGRG